MCAPRQSRCLDSVCWHGVPRKKRHCPTPSRSAQAVRGWSSNCDHAETVRPVSGRSVPCQSLILQSLELSACTPPSADIASPKNANACGAKLCGSGLLHRPEVTIVRTVVYREERKHASERRACYETTEKRTLVWNCLAQGLTVCQDACTL